LVKRPRDCLETAGHVDGLVFETGDIHAAGDLVCSLLDSAPLRRRLRDNARGKLRQVAERRRRGLEALVDSLI